jgi:hypothetical protein
MILIWQVATIFFMTFYDLLFLYFTLILNRNLLILSIIQPFVANDVICCPKSLVGNSAHEMSHLDAFECYPNHFYA